MGTMKNLFQQALNVLFPEPCIHCTQDQNHDLLLCPDCLAELPKQLHSIAAPELITQLWGMAEYASPAGSLIRRCKYKPDQRIFQALIKRMQCLDIPWHEFDAITHVPTSFSRTFFRGFDQAQILATLLSSSVSVPYLPLLKRVDPRVQSLRSREERTQRLSFRFSCIHSPPPKILLVDDVCTTGGTLEACAMSLLNEGSTHVSGLVICY